MENPTNHGILARRVETLLQADIFSAGLSVGLHELWPGCSPACGSCGRSPAEAPILRAPIMSRNGTHG